jgi:cytochrome c oxidase cbb3-type subunit 1
MHDSPQSASSSGVETRLVYAHGLAALVTLLISICFGFLAALEMLVPDAAGDSPWFTWGRLRYDHTQGIMLGYDAERYHR